MKSDCSDYYIRFKVVINAIYYSELNKNYEGWDQLIDLLKEKNENLRDKSNTRLGLNFSFCDGSDYEKKIMKSCVLGFVYEKSNGDERCDTFLIELNGNIEKLRNDEDMLKRCPKVQWRHKYKVWLIEPYKTAKDKF